MVEVIRPNVLVVERDPLGALIAKQIRLTTRIIFPTILKITDIGQDSCSSFYTLDPQQLAEEYQLIVASFSHGKDIRSDKHKSFITQTSELLQIGRTHLVITSVLHDDSDIRNKYGVYAMHERLHTVQSKHPQHIAVAVASILGFNEEL